MLQSMTAYGQSTASDGKRRDAKKIDVKQNGVDAFLWTLRSVNHRYLDVSVRLPVGFGELEPEIRARVAKTVHRGKIDISLALGATAKHTDNLIVDTQLLAQLQQALQTLSTAGIQTGPVEPTQLLQWPGLTSQRSDVSAKAINDAIQSFDVSLSDFVSGRLREGEQIAQMLETRATKMTQFLEQLRLQRPIVVERQRAKMIEKLAQAEVQHDPARLHQELVYYAQRLDVDEELDRLDAHIKELKKTLARDEPVGRRLDFLMQEFNREVNTLASKSSDSETTAITIELKVLIEQMREQVQNVE